MKSVVSIIFSSLVLFISLNSAQAQVIDRNRMAYIVDRVRNCSVLPYTVNRNHEKVYHAIRSHCPEVKVIEKGVAKIRVDGHAFMVKITESFNSDGDLFNIEFRDLVNGEVSQFVNVLAFGDVLLGVLGGQTRGLHEEYVADDSRTIDLDATLLR